MAEPQEPQSEGEGLPVGTMVGEFRIEAVLGEGGMGVVYAALHPVIGKKVAIKVLSALVTQDTSVIDRFLQEARAVNAIAHPNIVDIFSFGQLPDRRHYFVMERLEGETLGALLARDGHLIATRALSPFRDVGRALAAAHRNQIVHRDLKPDNIMVRPNEAGVLSAKLLDFGVAKLLGAGDRANTPKTRAGIAIGTPHYMAPEQCLGGAVDARSDLYSLGVVLFEALTGRRPFDGATVVEVWQGHVGTPPPRLSEVAPADSQISPELEALVLQLLAKNPANRLQSAAQFCEALDVVAPTLGQAPARSARPPRLDNPLERPPQSLLMTSPGGLTKPSDDEMARLAAAFEARFSEVVAIDHATHPEMAAMAPRGPAIGPPPQRTPTMDLDVDVEMALLPPSAARPAPVGDASAREEARYQPVTAPEVAIELGPARAVPPPARRTVAVPRPQVRAPARSPSSASGSNTWLLVVALAVLLGAGAAAFVFLRSG